jgi:hypothetical protein
MANAPRPVSTTLPTRMGLAVPSLAEASSRLPSSVKADPASADDVLVTSVASSPPAGDEPVSPELALVDPELRERLRDLLPEIELEPPPPVLRALPDPESEADRALTPPPELVEAPGPVPAPVATLPVRPAPVYLYPTRGERMRSFAKAFALGAAAATVITVGVVAELGDGPAATEDPGTTPPRVAAPVPVPAPSDTSGGSTITKPATGTKTQPKGATKPKIAAGKSSAPRQQKAPPPPAASSEPRRFAWAPVEGAVGYRLELFRGDRQVFETRTKQPVYELPTRWRHDGVTQTLTTGDYRWYVWPLLANGQSRAAVVQARLTVP